MTHKLQHRNKAKLSTKFVQAQIPSAPKTCIFRGFCGKIINLVVRWPKPLFFMALGAYGTYNSVGPSQHPRPVIVTGCTFWRKEPEEGHTWDGPEAKSPNHSNYHFKRTWILFRPSIFKGRISYQGGKWVISESKYPTHSSDMLCYPGTCAKAAIERHQVWRWQQLQGLQCILPTFGFFLSEIQALVWPRWPPSYQGSFFNG